MSEDEDAENIFDASGVTNFSFLLNFNSPWTYFPEFFVELVFPLMINIY